MTTTELALETNRGVSTTQLWCKKNKIKMFKGRYYINPLQAEMYKSQLDEAETERAKRRKEYNYIYYHTKTKIINKVDKQIAEEKANKKAKELLLKEQVLKPIVSNDAILKSRIKKLKLLVEVAELDLLKSAVMREINTLDNV